MLAARYAYATLAWLFVAGVLTQAFLAGAGLFKWTTMAPHAAFGYGVTLLPALMLVLAHPARLDRRTVLLNFAMFFMATILQPSLAYAREDAPVIAALHPVNALLLFALGIVVARRSMRLVRASHRVRAMRRAHAT